MIKNILKLVIVLLTFFIVSCTYKNDNDIKKNNENIEIKDYNLETTSISLIMGGDAVIHGSVYLDNNIKGKYDFDYPLSEIKGIISSYDLAYYNQETILGGTELGLSHYPQFNSPQEVGDSFVKTGFNLVSLATNHTLDGYDSKGRAYVDSSCDYWNNQYKTNNVISSGSYKSEEDKNKIIIGEEKGIKYALLSYTYGTNGIAAKENYLVNYIDKETIKNDVLKYRNKVDLLLVAMHWGNEYSFIPTKTQKDLANFLADLDVDIVIGNHPHVIEPIEWIDDTLIIYSLGNIISAQYMTGSDMFSLGFGRIIDNQKYTVETLTGMLVSVKITKNINDFDNKVNISDLKAQLIYTDYKDRWKVYPYAKLNNDILDNHEIYFNYFKDIINNGVEIEIQ